MNQQTITYENYPWTTPLLENIVWLGVFSLGSIIFLLFNTWAALTYLGYSLLCIYLLIPRFVCTSCSYYGKTCHSGQGKLAALLFSRGDTALFNSNFKYMRLAAPVFLAPIIAGLVLFFLNISWERTALTIGFGVLALWCTRIVTRSLGCPHCKQKPECPGCRNIQT
jgi:hypothetical protein